MNELIETSSGTLRGKKTENGYYFRCFPYSLTPRFEKPQPYHWWGIFDCDAQETVNCPQRCGYGVKEEDDFYDREFYFSRKSNYDENHMTMSVISPLNAEKCPVVVFIHGGSFDNGLVDEVPFGECYEYAKRGIVFVSIGYRLNVFGLYRSANYNLLDQEFAIEWVRENIAAFGGDPDHIVLMGQSAGAMCVNNLLLDKKLKGKVKGAIIISGYGTIPSAFGAKRADDKAVKEFWDKVIRDAGCSSEEDAKKVDAERLWRSWYKNKAETKSQSVKACGIDGEIIRDEPKEMLKRNEDLDIPVLFGVTSQDMFPEMIFEIACRAANRAAALGRKVYGYFFDYTLPGDCFHAFHGCDMWYLFNNMHKSWRPFGRFDYQLSKKMIDYMANFIINYNPNGEGLENWPEFSDNSRLLRLFSNRGKALITTNLCRAKIAYTAIKDRGPY